MQLLLEFVFAALFWALLAERKVPKPKPSTKDSLIIMANWRPSLISVDELKQYS